MIRIKKKQIIMDTYEKKYKDALERAKEWYNDQHITIGLKGNLKDIFPELKESEDKQAKEWILEYLYDGLRKSDKQFKEQFKAAINSLKKHWLESKDAIELEKQDKSNPYSGVSFEYNGHTWGMCARDNGVDILLDKQIFKHLEKQGEQQPFDKVEPKFKVGDWITDGEYTWKIVEVEHLDYILKSQYGSIVDDTIFYVDEHFHLWTIADAKDGDVLAFDNGHIILVKENYNSTWGRRLSCWCHLLDGKFEVVEYHTKTEGLHPATKEQCALLFSKMKEAGYEWDAEKKELKNVEQNSVWSEEDDAYIALISGILNYEHRHGQFTTNGIKFFNNNIIAVEQIQDWLESLKDKVQPKWKPTEEQMNAFYWMKQYSAGEFAKKDILNSLYNDLKKL